MLGSEPRSSGRTRALNHSRLCSHFHLWSSPSSAVWLHCTHRLHPPPSGLRHQPPQRTSTLLHFSKSPVSRHFSSQQVSGQFRQKEIQLQGQTWGAGKTHDTSLHKSCLTSTRRPCALWPWGPRRPFSLWREGSEENQFAHHAVSHHVKQAESYISLLPPWPPTRSQPSVSTQSGKTQVKATLLWPCWPGWPPLPAVCCSCPDLWYFRVSLWPAETVATREPLPSDTGSTLSVTTVLLIEGQVHLSCSLERFMKCSSNQLPHNELKSFIIEVIQYCNINKILTV